MGYPYEIIELPCALSEQPGASRNQLLSDSVPRLEEYIALVGASQGDAQRDSRLLLDVATTIPDTDHAALLTDGLTEVEEAIGEPELAP